MELETLTEQLADHKVKVGFLTKSLYKMLAPMIGESETIQIAAEGLASGNKAPIVITDTHVYLASYANLMGGPQFAAISRGDVTSVEIRGGLLGSVVIHTRGTSYPVDRIPGPIAAQIMGTLK